MKNRCDICGAKTDGKKLCPECEAAVLTRAAELKQRIRRVV